MQRKWTMRRTQNQVPKRGILNLRDEVIKQLEIADPEFNGYGNMIENVITVLQRRGKLLWDRLPEPRIIEMTSAELRSLSQQVLLFHQLESISGSAFPHQAIQFRRRTLGRLFYAPDQVRLVIETDDEEIDWHTAAQFDKLYPSPPIEITDEDYDS